jgi:hypothetical protein
VSAIRPAILVALGLLLIPGCGSGTSSKPAPTSDGTLRGTLTYHRSGGLAGRSDALTLKPGGSATVAARFNATRTVTLNPAELKAVERALANVDLARLDAEYKPPGPVADGVGETVTYGGRRVSTATGAEPPRQLVSLLVTLSGLVDRYAPKG